VTGRKQKPKCDDCADLGKPACARRMDRSCFRKKEPLLTFSGWLKFNKKEPSTSSFLEYDEYLRRNGVPETAENAKGASGRPTRQDNVPLERRRVKPQTLSDLQELVRGKLVCGAKTMQTALHNKMIMELEQAVAGLQANAQTLDKLAGHAWALKPDSPEFQRRFVAVGEAQK